MEKTEKVMENHGIFCNLKSMNPVLKKRTVYVTEVVQKMSAREDPPFRPVVPVDACKTELRTLMQQCWDDDPDKRPHFNKILDRLRKVMGRYMLYIDCLISSLLYLWAEAILKTMLVRITRESFC